METTALVWIPLLPLLGALINLTIGKRLSHKTVHTIAIASVAGAFLVWLSLLAGPLVQEFRAGNGGRGLSTVLWTWMEIATFKVQLALRMDTLSAVMVGIVTFVGTLIHIYSTGYMHGERRYAAYFGYLNLFTGSMLILVLAANMPVMFIGWEGVGLCSFLLIGFWFENKNYAAAGRKAFVVNRVGDFAFILGMFLLYWLVKDQGFAQSLDFADLRSEQLADVFVNRRIFDGGEKWAAVVGILLFVGACGKSAQIPLYVWLPDAMAGPTPVSALIHAATMVTAGVYMICRLSFLYASSTTALAVVAIVGLITALAAAFMAFAQTDLKKVLAYSTVSQLGFMFVAAGTGNWVAAIFHLGTHAFFKAGLFLGAGSIMHGMDGSGDIEIMGGLRSRMKITHITFAIYCLAIAGFPLTAGFFSKDEILAGAWGAHPPDWPPMLGKILWGGLLAAALGTTIYMWRLYFMVFGGKARSETAEHAHESPVSMWGPLAVLAVLSLVAGFFGMPHFEGIHLPGIFHGLSAWLAPSLTQTWPDAMVAGHGLSAAHASITAHNNDSTTWMLLGIAISVFVIGWVAAKALYGQGRVAAVDSFTAGAARPLYLASKNKLWVDELYELIVIKPFQVIANGFFYIVDRFMIDTVVVSGTAWVTQVFARLARGVQNGQVHRYMLAMLLGGGLIFAVTKWRHTPGIIVTEDGDFVELRADLGNGLTQQNVMLEWDLDGDGQVDRDASDRPLTDFALRVPRGMVGALVTVRVTSPMHKDGTTLTKRIALKGGQ